MDQFHDGMYQTSLIVRTKLAPPRPPKYTLPRPRLTQRILEARHYRLTIVQAGTGYGKSTALAALTNEPVTLIWYRLDTEDTDPQRFLAHLLYSFVTALPGLSDAPIAALEEWSSNRSANSWTAVTDSLINECTRTTDPGASYYLVLDDAHLLNHARETIDIISRLISLAPGRANFSL